MLRMWRSASCHSPTGTSPKSITDSSIAAAALTVFNWPESRQEATLTDSNNVPIARVLILIDAPSGPAAGFHDQFAYPRRPVWLTAELPGIWDLAARREVPNDLREVESSG